MSDSEAIWLIRSGARIIGPLTTEAVKQALKDRDLLPHDEISMPFSRWRLAMYQPEFEEVIAILNSSTGVEPTRSASTMQTERTLGTYSRTETVSNLSDDKINEGMVTDIYVEEDKTYVTTSPPTGAKSPGSDYAFVSQKSVNEKINNQSQGIWIITILICIALVGGVGYYKFSQRAMDASAHFDELLRQGILAKLHGDNIKAAAIFRELKPETSDNIDLLYHYGPLAINYEKQSLLGRRLMERLLASDQGNQYFAAAQTGIGLARIYEGDLSVASQHFKEAIVRDPGFYPAIFNQGIVEFQKKNYDQAIVKFNEAVKLSISQTIWRDGSAGFMQAIAADRLSRKDKSPLVLEMALENVQRYLRFKSGDIAEGLLLKGWLEHLLGKDREARSSLIHLLNTTPGLTNFMVYDPLLYREYLTWPLLLDYCLNLTKALGDDGDMIAVRGMCLASSGKNIEALKTLETGEAAAINNAMIKSVQAYVYYLMGKTGEARGALRAAANEGPPVLKEFVAGQICFDAGDFRCAENHFSTVLIQHPNSLLAVTRLAEIKVAMGEKSEAQDLIARAFEQGRDFGPLLKLRYELGRH